MPNTTEQLDNILVVKVGTTTMLRNENRREVLDEVAFKRIGDQVLALRASGHHVTIVSSGAVTAGMEATNTPIRPSNEAAMPEMQRLATIGWRHVLNAWYDATGVENGSILITQRELNLHTPEHDEALRTTHTLLSHGEIPILNENDAITHGELSHLSFGQNDTLAAIYAAQIAGSSLFGKHVRLVLLSDVDGVYEDVRDPSSLIKEINDPSKYLSSVGDSNSLHGTGGMSTKFAAAAIAKNAGVEMWIANGKTDDAISRTLNGELGTHFSVG